MIELSERERERAAVVAWLDKKFDLAAMYAPDEAHTIAYIQEGIERGDHLGEDNG